MDQGPGMGGGPVEDNEHASGREGLALDPALFLFCRKLGLRRRQSSQLFPSHPREGKSDILAQDSIASAGHKTLSFRCWYAKETMTAPLLLQLLLRVRPIDILAMCLFANFFLSDLHDESPYRPRS